MPLQPGTTLGSYSVTAKIGAGGMGEVYRGSDIWAFGRVLYEMLTGTRAFEGRDVSETLAGVIKTDPSWGSLPPDTPRHLHNVLRRCLAKEPRQRVQAIGDVRLAMEGAFDTAGGPTADMVPVASPTNDVTTRWRPSLSVSLGLSLVSAFVCGGDSVDVVVGGAAGPAGSAVGGGRAG